MLTVFPQTIFYIWSKNLFPVSPVLCRTYVAPGYCKLCQWIHGYLIRFLLPNCCLNFKLLKNKCNLYITMCHKVMACRYFLGTLAFLACKNKNLISCVMRMKKLLMPCWMKSIGISGVAQNIGKQFQNHIMPGKYTVVSGCTTCVSIHNEAWVKGPINYFDLSIALRSIQFNSIQNICCLSFVECRAAS
jgi:hypothetical protein